MSDYDALSEFHDLFMTAPWARLAPAVAEAFGDLGAEDVVVDVGAGTGLGTLTLADATAARVWALEPSRAMRSVLLHRVAASQELSARISVVAGAVPEALSALPSRVHGVLATHMVGHLSQSDRAAWWRWLSAALAPGAVALITHEPAVTRDDGGDGDDGVGDDDFVQERVIGVHTYRVAYLADSGARTFRSRYDVLLGDDVVRSVEIAGTWRTITLDDLRAETAPHGLEVSDTALAGVTQVGRAKGARPEPTTPRVDVSNQGSRFPVARSTSPR